MTFGEERCGKLAIERKSVAFMKQRAAPASEFFFQVEYVNPG
jgi:hypothetical protein